MAGYTVFGLFPDNMQRVGSYYSDAESPAQAEQYMYEDNPSGVWVASVVANEVTAVDTYALYVDAEDERHSDPAIMRSLEPCEEFLEATEFTVFGIIREPGDTRWNRANKGQRYCKTVEATSAAAAEGVAQSYAADERGELWVCGVAQGTHLREDGYAYFVEADREATN